jgi:hypothetical protein
MSKRGVTLTPHQQGAGALPDDFTIGTEEESVGHKGASHIVSPQILILTVVAFIFFLFSLVYDASPAQLSPLERRIRDEKVMERQSEHIRLEHKTQGAELQKLLGDVERQILVVSRAEGRGDRALAKQELRKLMLMDGGHANSPLYKFCVSRIKEHG